MVTNVFGILFSPNREWTEIRDKDRVSGRALLHILILATIPAVAGYYGAVHIGWNIGDSPTRFLTPNSALKVFIPCYFAQVAIILLLGYAIQWMAQTYGSSPDRGQSLALAAYSATPLFLVGFAALYPSLWLFMLAGLVAIAHSVYLLYTGVPIVMKISSEQGFVFSSAILTIGLVMLMGLMVVTVLAWSFGLTPIFT